MSELTTAALRLSALRTRGIYQKIALNGVYAARVKRELNESDVNGLARLFRQVTTTFNTVSASPAGFVIGFEAVPPADEIFNALTVRGNVSFTVREMRSVSLRILPLYLVIASNARFAASLVRTARARNNALLRRRIAPLVLGRGLVSVSGDERSILMEVRASSGKVFTNQFFVL